MSIVRFTRIVACAAVFLSLRCDRYEPQKHKLTQGTINQAKTALEAFKIDNGRFPTTAEGLSALVNRPAGLTNWQGPYVDMTSLRADAWGNPYVYRFPGKTNPVRFDLSSSGPDGREGNDDDVH